MDIYKKFITISINKSSQHLFKQFISSFLAGNFLAFSACCSFRVGGEIKFDLGINRLISGIFGVPIGLLLIILTNTQIFNANIAIYYIGFYEKKIKFKRIFKSISIIYLGNFIGSLFFALLITGSQILKNNNAIIEISENKIIINWYTNLIRGILCNWFVCLAIWQSLHSKNTIDKAIGIILPIAGFITLGLEHCVSNMYIIPQGMMLGANISIYNFFFNNIIPVTLGNIISSIFLFALPFCFIYNNNEIEI